MRSEPSSPGARPDTLVFQVQDLERLAARDLGMEQAAHAVSVSQASRGFGVEDPDVIAYALHPGDCRKLVVQLLQCMSECGDRVATQVLDELFALVDRLRTERDLDLDDSFQDT